MAAERDGQRLLDAVGGGRPGSKRTCTRGCGGGQRAPGSLPLMVTLPSLDPQGVHTALPGKGAEPLRGESPTSPRDAWRPGLGGHGHSGCAALCCSPLRQLQAPRTGTLMRGRGRGPAGLPDGRSLSLRPVELECLMGRTARVLPDPLRAAPSTSSHRRLHLV